MTRKELEYNIEKLKRNIFFHEMDDHWTQEDFVISRKMESELNEYVEMWKELTGEEVYKPLDK